MGWSIFLKNGFDEICLVAPFDAGSEVMHDDYQVKAVMSVTFNYRPLFNFGWLGGQKAKNTITVMKDRIQDFGQEPASQDYWECTKGNVRKILVVLVSWAEMHPEAIWTAQ